MTTVITFSNHERGEVFFSTDHCQGVMDDSIIDRSWTPVTARLPVHITPRPGYENGIVRTIDGYIDVFYSGMKLIANPDERFRR